MNIPFRHAGIYTTEEATLITRKKMMRLQTLYLEQIQRLQYLLKEKRRTYLQTARGEKETLCKCWVGLLVQIFRNLKIKHF